MSRSSRVALLLLVSACDGDLAGSGGASAGNGVTAASQTTSAAGGPTSSSTGQAPSAVTLSLYNVVRDEPWPTAAPLPAVVRRVEIPPRTTIAALAGDDVRSIRFFVDGAEARLDDARPFLLDEDEMGVPEAWSLAFGAHEIEVRAFAGAAGEGAPIETTTWSFDLSDVGLAPGFTELSESENDAWVQMNLDDVMEARTFEGSEGTLPYRLYVPEDYDGAASYPVLVYLHGRGQRGDDNRPELYRWTRLFTGPRSILSPNFRHAYPAILVVPQCSDMPTHHEWAHWIGNSEQQPFAGLGSDGSYMQHADPWSSATHVHELVAALAGEYAIDLDRVYLTGESMGGFGTWEFTTRWPETWAAGVPMAGFSDRTKVDRILKIPFWVFHGDADSSNPVAGSRAMVEALEGAGGEVRYTEYAGAEHGPTFEKAWTEEPELLPWIFAQRRGAIP